MIERIVLSYYALQKAKRDWRSPVPSGHSGKGGFGRRPTVSHANLEELRGFAANSPDTNSTLGVGLRTQFLPPSSDRRHRLQIARHPTFGALQEIAFI